MIFENQEIPVSSLPHVEDISFQPLAPAGLKARYWSNVLTSAVFFVLALMILPPLFSAWWWLSLIILTAAMAAWLLFSSWVIRKRFERESYALRTHDIIHQHGYWWHSQTTVPFTRVQHVEIAQGPVEKRFGVSTLRVFTAGGSSSDLSISGIEPEEANRIKSFIVQKAGVDAIA